MASLSPASYSNRCVSITKEKSRTKQRSLKGRHIDKRCGQSLFEFSCSPQVLTTHPTATNYNSHVTHLMDNGRRNIPEPAGVLVQERKVYVFFCKNTESQHYIWHCCVRLCPVVSVLAILSSRRRVSVRWHSDACLLGWMEEHLPGEGRDCWRQVGTHGHGGGGSRAKQHDISWNESTSSPLSLFLSYLLICSLTTQTTDLVNRQRILLLSAPTSREIYTRGFKIFEVSLIFHIWDVKCSALFHMTFFF